MWGFTELINLIFIDGNCSEFNVDMIYMYILEKLDNLFDFIRNNEEK